MTHSSEEIGEEPVFPNALMLQHIPEDVSTIMIAHKGKHRAKDVHGISFEVSSCSFVVSSKESCTSTKGFSVTSRDHRSVQTKPTRP